MTRSHRQLVSERFLLAVLVICLAWSYAEQANAQTCASTITHLDVQDGQVVVDGKTTLSGCSLGSNAWQQVFLDRDGGYFGGNSCTQPADAGGTCTATNQTADTRCLADGTYHINATGQCNVGTGTCPQYPITTSDTQPFTLHRNLSVSLSSQVNAGNSNSYDISANYTITNAYAVDRHITLYDAKTKAWLGACVSSATRESSATCPLATLDASCGLDLLAEATACNLPGKATDHISIAPTAPAGSCPVFRSCPTCDGVGQPINVGGGDVTVSLPLFSLAEPAGALDLTLYFESERPAYAAQSGEMGFGWSNVLTQSLRSLDAAGDYLYNVGPTGIETVFHRSGSAWTALAPASVRDTITQVGTQYRVTTLEGTVTAFDTMTGHWLSTTDRWGNATNATYDVAGNLTSVTDPVGRMISVVATGTTLQQLTLPGGAQWTFGYTNGNLTSIWDPLHPATGPAWRTMQYTFNRVSEPRLLTSLKDDAGVSIEEHTYDALDRALTSNSAGGRDQVTIAYDVPSAGMRRVTHQLSATTTQVRDYMMTVTNNHWAPTAVTGGCATCGMQPGESRVYDTSGRITTKTDAAAVSTTSSYDSNNNTLSMTEAAGTPLARTSTYEYAMSSWPDFQTKETVPSPFGTRVTTRSLSSDERTLTVSVTGRTASGATPTTFTTTTTFDARHRVTSVDGPRTDVSDVVARTYYDDADTDVNRRGRLQSETANGLTTTYDNYDVYGTPGTITDPNGVSTTVQSDTRGRVTTTTSNAVTGDANESTAYTTTSNYDSRDRLISTITPRGNVTTYAYEDGTNRLIDTVQNDASGNQVARRHLTLNLVGWKMQEELQSCASPASPCTSWTTRRSDTFAYDDFGDLQSVVHPDASSRTFSYDSMLRLSGIKDENHSAANTTYAYDVLGRLSSVTQTLGSGQAATGYTYDVQDNLATVTDPNGNVTSYSYDDFGRLIQQSSPVTGTTSYAYDSAGNLTSTTDANVATTTRTYDSMNRMTNSASTRSGATTENVTFAYDATTANAYARGRLSQTTSPAGSTTYAYERRGQIRTETKTLEGNSYTTNYAYDADGNRTTVTTPSGRAVAYTYDYANRPMTATTSGTTLASSAGYLPFGPLTTLSYGNGTSLTRTFDTQYRITSNQLVHGATTLAQYTYSYDLAGNITGIADALDSTYSRTFGYDDLNRLTTANSGSSLWGSGSYSYDAMGNMTAIHLGDARNATFNYVGTTPELSSVFDNGQSLSVAYDAAGNETSVGGRSYAYTSRNSLGNTQGFNYVYDERGVRAISSTTGTGLTLTSLTINPTTAGGGDTVTGTLTLSGAAPAGGATVTLTTDDERIVNVPPSVFVPSGATTATVNITTLRPAASSVTTTIRAFHQGSTASASITVLLLPRVTSVSVSPSSVVGGNGSTGTVTLDVTNSNPTTVTLSSDQTAATVPSSVTVPANTLTATFSITTSVVSANTTATITAMYRGTATAALAITPVPVVLNSISLNPVQVVGAKMNSTATVTLNVPAGADTAITLTSSNTSVATTPSTVTVPAGSSNASFTVTTSTVTGATPVTISAAYGGNTRTADLDVRSCSDWTPVSASLGTETVYLDDSIPAGASSSNWTWDTTQMASGTQSVVVSTAGNLESHFSNYPNFFHINATEQMVFYAMIDPCNPPREIMIQFQMCCDGWNHRAFWGEDLLAWDTLGKDRIYMGPVPVAGAWLRLTVPASLLGLANSDIFGVAFNVAGGGRAWFDRVGKASCSVTTTVPAPASFPSGDVVWFDDATPSGASLNGTWNWDTTQKASGTKSHDQPRANNDHQQIVTTSTAMGTPAANDKLVTYVLLDPCDPPNEVMLQFNDGSGWEHRAYWGGNAIGYGSNGTNSRRQIGDLPPIGQWTRLEVTASSIGLSNVPVFGMAFTIWNGHAWFDRSGLAPASSGSLAPQAPIMTASNALAPPIGVRARMFAWMKRVVTKVWGGTPPPPVGLQVTAHLTASTAAVGPTRQYSFYTPELQLLSETSLTDASALSIAYDYVWFGGEPLAQITTSTSDMNYYFNDHLGAPLMQATSTASVIWHAERDAYGERFVTRFGGDRHQPLGLPGQEQTENGPELKYNIFRWYRAGWGQYTQADPAHLRDDDNLFLYGNANPLKWIDADGRVETIGNGCINGCPSGGGFNQTRSDRLQEAFTTVCKNADKLGPYAGVSACVKKQCKLLRTIQCDDPVKCSGGALGEMAESRPSAITVCSASDNGLPGNCTNKGTVLHEMMHKCWGPAPNQTAHDMIESVTKQFYPTGGPCF